MLRTLIICTVISVTGLGASHTIAQASPEAVPQSVKFLGNASAQMVLAFTTVSLMIAVIWVVRKLLTLQDQRVQEVKEIFKDTIEKNTTAIEESSNVGRSATTALHRVADSHTLCAEARTKEHDLLKELSRRNGQPTDG